MQIAQTDRQGRVGTSGMLLSVVFAGSLLAGCGGDDNPIRADDLAFPPAGPRPVVRTIDANLGPVGFVSADAGALVWSAPRGSGLRLLARPRPGAPVREIVRRFQRRPKQGSDEVPRAFDTGRGPDGRPVVVWTQGCDRKAPCVVRSVSVAGGSTRVIARLPKTARTPVAIDGDRLAYVASDAGCDELRLLTLPNGPDRGLGRGTCGRVEQIDIQESTVAAAALTEPPDDGFPSEAWLSDTQDGGVRIVQDEDAGYSGPDRIVGVSLDGEALYTVRFRAYGPGSQVTRIPLDGGSASVARIYSNLGVLTYDRGQTFAVDTFDEGRRSALVQYKTRHP